MIHKCSYCDYQSPYKGNLKTHVKNKHGNNITSNTVSVGYDTARAPTHQLGSGIQTNEPTLHCESGPAEIYQPNTVSMQDYTKATESAHGWKNAYENLNKQRGSGVFTRADIDKEVMNVTRGDIDKEIMHFVTPWQIAHQKEKEKNNELVECIYNEQLEKENLPIYMDKEMINKINMLRSVKRNHDMGLYPDELIHCICQALHNTVYCSNDIAQGLENTKLKILLRPIREYIDKLMEPELSMKKKRRILSKPQVGKGVFTALASFVIPALISLISKK